MVCAATHASSRRRSSNPSIVPQRAHLSIGGENPRAPLYRRREPLLADPPPPHHLETSGMATNDDGIFRPTDEASIALLRGLHTRTIVDRSFIHRADVCSAAPEELVADLQPVPGTDVTEDGYNGVTVCGISTARSDTRIPGASPASIGSARWSPTAARCAGTRRLARSPCQACPAPRSATSPTAARRRRGRRVGSAWTGWDGA